MRLSLRRRAGHLVETMEPRMLLSSMLVFTAAPSATSAGSIINSGTGVQVTVETSAGTTVTTSSDSITLSLTTNPSGTTLHGTLIASAVSGVATFSTLYITQAINGYKLLATDTTTPSVTAATSAAFNINAIPFVNTLNSLTIGNGGYSPYSGLVRDSAGNLYGTTEAGGLYDNGTVYELSGTNHTTYTTLVSFTDDSGSYPGDDPQTDLIIDSSGNLYGTTNSGGAFEDGTAFELSGTNHTIFTSLVTFTGDSGNYPGSGPSGTIVLDSSGNLYGTTSSGGISNDSGGTAYELSGTGHTTFKSLCSFTGASGTYPGASPDAGLVIDSSGNLYGTTDNGGSENAGEVFELSGTAHTNFTLIYSFINGTEVFPNGLLFDSSGNLYGTTLYDGADGSGSVYELSGTTHATFTDLVDFTDDVAPNPGESPDPNMVFYSGNLFGMTNEGGTNDSGSVFELSGPLHRTFTSLISFDGDTDSTPDSGFCVDGSGNFFGTTAGGGADGLGNVIEIPVASRTTVATVYSFNAGSGTYASSSLTASGSYLFGTTSNGGAFDDGTIYELSGTGYSTHATIAQFNSGGANDQGTDPESTLLLDSSGNFYGTTDYGGSNGTGEVFELTATAHTLTNLYSFPAYSGTNNGTNSNLTIDSSGNLYVSYTIGDQSNDGTVVELSGTGHATITTLVTFTGTAGNDPGEFPGQILIYGGNLYGTTSAGGVNSDGVVFELSGTSHNTYSKLLVFAGSNGSKPNGVLTVDSSGNLYGTTATGGTYNDGTVYELPGTAHTSLSTLINFNGSNGSTPNPTLTIDSSSNLFGTTAAGGTSGDGTTFELSGTSHATFATLVSFTGTAGSAPGTTPQNGLTLDSSGNLYGATGAGGVFNDGTLFELSGTGHATFTSLFPFNGGSADVDPFLVADSTGNLYGTTRSGGTYGLGSVFELTSSGVANLTATTGTVTIASPSTTGIGSYYFSSISIAGGAVVAFTPGSSAHSVIMTGSLTIAGSIGAWTGQLDITNDDLDVTGGSLSVITNQIKQGFNNGSWTGLGITSSTAAANTSHLTALGVLQNNQSGSALFASTNLLDGTMPGTGDVLIKYTYYGDANLDGKVDGSDYSLIDNGYLNHLTSWFNGDFNYDGVINGSDYTLIDNAFNTQGASLAAAKVSASRASMLVSKTAQPTSIVAESLLTNNNLPILYNDIVMQGFASDSDDLVKRSKFFRRYLFAVTESRLLTPFVWISNANV